MAGELNGRHVAFLAADGVERVELEQPREALEQVGARTTLLSIHDGQIVALVLPGGTVDRGHGRPPPDSPDDLAAFCKRIVQEFAGTSNLTGRQRQG
jgi:hypothetical protein